MAETTRISQLSAHDGKPAGDDLLVMVDVSDDTQSAEGSTKRIKYADVVSDLSVSLSQSANWQSTYTTVNTNSASWDTAYTTVTANSAAWDHTTSGYLTSVNIPTSANWDTAYSTVTANSASWSGVGSVSLSGLDDVQTTGADHAPEADDLLVWNATHGHWMPGDVTPARSPSLTTTPAQDDMLIISDVSDTTGTSLGTTKSVTVEKLLSAPLPIKFGDDVGGANFKTTATAGELFFDTTEERLYIAISSAGRNNAYIIAISSQEAVNATASAEGSAVFNITDRSTENSLFTSSFTLPSGKAIIAYGTDTEDLYIFYDGQWKTYENDL